MTSARGGIALEPAIVVTVTIVLPIVVISMLVSRLRAPGGERICKRLGSGRPSRLRRLRRHRRSNRHSLLPSLLSSASISPWTFIPPTASTSAASESGALSLRRWPVRMQ